MLTFLAGPGVTGVSWEPTDGASIESSLSTSIMETCPTWGIITADGSFCGLMGWKYLIYFVKSQQIFNNAISSYV